MGLSAEDAQGLSISERIKLVTDIWDSVAEQADEIELKNETKTTVGRMAENS